MGNQRRFALIGRGFGSDNFDEYAQDLVGALFVDSSELNFTYTDATPSLTAALIDASITFARLQNFDALSVLGRSANTSGVADEITAAAAGDILHRNGTTLQFGLTLPGDYIFTGLDTFQNNIQHGVKSGTNAPTYYSYQIPRANGQAGWADILGGRNYSATQLTGSVFIGTPVPAGINNGTNPGPATGGTSNIGIGSGAMTALTTGRFNVAIGSQSGTELTTTLNNTFIGFRAGRFVNASRNVAIGQSCYAGVTGVSAGVDNTVIGDNTFFSATTADECVAIGAQALNLLTTGDRNTALGMMAGDTVVTGEWNTFVGYQAGRQTLGSRNVMLGYRAGDAELGSDTLYIANSETTTPLIIGTFPNTLLGFNAALVRLLRDNDELQIGAGQDLRLYHNGTNSIVENDTGDLILRCNGDFVFEEGAFEAPDGAVGAPQYSFTNDTDCGLYRIGANNIGLSTNGVLRWDVSTAAITSALPLLGADGAAGAPAYAFTNDADCGLYRIGANNIGAAANGALVWDWNATRANFDVPIQMQGYTVATLPAGTQGFIAYVTDALAPAFLTAIVGGGAIVTPVFYDGTNWVAI